MAVVREGGDDGEKEKSSAFRCLDAVRYAVSAMVVVLIVAVFAKAINIVLRPDKLDLSVPGSTVYTQRIPSRSRVEADNKLILSFSLQGTNPSGRASMYYYNVTAYLFDNTTAPATTPTPGPDSLFFYYVDDMAVPQLQSVSKNMQSPMISRDPANIAVSFFDALERGPAATVSDVTIRVDGTLVTESRLGYNTTPKPTTYYCRQIIVGLSPEDKASVSSQATSCTTTAP